MALRRTALVVLASALLYLAGCASGSSSSSASTAPQGTTAGTAVPDDGLVDIGNGVRGPSGLAATVYATGLTNVAALAFDAEGRLWVATADFEDKGNDAVYVVTAPGATPTKVITDVHTPLGLLWHDGTLYVSSKERVDTFTGFDGKAFTTEGTILQLPEGVGEVNGLALGPDGRLRLGISAPCDSCTPTIDESGTVLSFALDGSDVQVVASDIRAPIGLTYYPGTDDLFVTMNQQDGLGAATPGDWLAVVKDGQQWGFPACYGQGGDVCAGVPSPIAEVDTHAAVSGVAIVTGQLGSAVGTSAIVAEWASGKVQRVALAKAGSTYTGTVSPFLTGIEKPVPVLLASDGSVLVGDWLTGKVFRIAPS